MLSAAAGAPFFRVWPEADNKSLDRPGSPGVVRNGQRLEFKGATPWIGRHASGDRAGHRVSFGDAPPEETPEPATWEHYAPDAVVLHGKTKGTTSLAPIEFERNARLGFFVLTFVQNLLIVTVFYFVVSLLLRFKRIDTRVLSPLHVLARCLVPAGLFCAALMMIGTPLAGTLAACVFVFVMAINAQLFILGAKPATPEEPFAV